MVVIVIPICIQAASSWAASSAPQLTGSKPASPPPCRLDVILNAKWNEQGRYLPDKKMMRVRKKHRRSFDLLIFIAETAGIIKIIYPVPKYQFSVAHHHPFRLNKAVLGRQTRRLTDSGTIIGPRRTGTDHLMQ